MRPFPWADLGTRHSYAAGIFVVDSKGRLLCAAHGRAHWRRTPTGWLIGLGAIGGSMEPGERPSQAARRETREELGCEARLQHSRRTHLIDLAGRVHEVRYAERPAPFLLVRYRARKRAPSRPVIRFRTSGMESSTPAPSAGGRASTPPRRSSSCCGFRSLWR